MDASLQAATIARMAETSNGKRVLALLGALGAAVYLLNPTLGVFELLPDNLPGVGNLDEVAVTGLLFTCIRALRRPVVAVASAPRVEPLPPSRAGPPSERR